MSPKSLLGVCLLFVTQTVAHAAEPNPILQRAELERDVLNYRQQLTAHRLSSVRLLYDNRHASLQEYVTAVAHDEKAANELAAVTDLLNSLYQGPFEDDGPGQVSLLIPGFESHADLRRIALQPLPPHADWQHVVDSQSYRRKTNAFLGSDAWKMQYDKLVQLDDSDQNRIQSADLNLRISIADERIRELEFQPVQYLSESRFSRIVSFREDRQVQLAMAKRGRARRVTQRLSQPSVTVEPSLITSVSYSRTPDSQQNEHVETSGEMSDGNLIETLTTAITVCRFRIDSAIKVVASRRRQRRQLQDQIEGAVQDDIPYELQLQLVNKAYDVANRELELRRAEHLYLIGRRGVIRQRHVEDYRDWKTPLCRIFELRGEECVAQLADVKSKVEADRLQKMESLFEDGFASWKEMTDARVRHGRSVWLRDLSEHRSRVSRQIVAILKECL